MKKDATFYQDGTNPLHRLLLTRDWAKGPRVNFIGHNPSIADDVRDDATVRKCIGFARRWGFAGIAMTNLFSLVSTDPNPVYAATEPSVALNDGYIVSMAQEAGRVIVCWGHDPRAAKRIAQVLPLLKKVKLECIGLTATGSPRHPSRAPYARMVESFTP